MSAEPPLDIAFSSLASLSLIACFLSCHFRPCMKNHSALRHVPPTPPNHSRCSLHPCADLRLFLGLRHLYHVITSRNSIIGPLRCNLQLHSHCFTDSLVAMPIPRCTWDLSLFQYRVCCYFGIHV